MIKNVFLLIALSACPVVHAGTVIKKIVDSSGRITYTNLSSDTVRGKIIKKFDTDGILYLRNTRPSLARHVIKTSSNRYSFRPGYDLPSLFHLTDNNYRSNSYGASPSAYNKSKFSSLIADAASRNQVDEKLVHAVIQAESAYNPSAVSRTGAVGLMQLMPGTAKRYGVMNRTDPEQNVDGGTRYLKDLLDMFNYNLGLAVAAYNAGEGAVMKYNNSIPPYPETRNYVKQVLSLYHRPL